MRMRCLTLLTGGALVVSSAHARNNLTRTPPMGWMSWEIFRCEIDCSKNPTACIDENLYKAQTDALVSGGFLAAGYNGIHMDDCWERKNPPRDPTTHQLVADPQRFPGGMKALGEYMHAKGVRYALYSAASTETCGGYPASLGYEDLDAQTFASWSVDYLYDGCGDTAKYPGSYQAMGAALEKYGPIEYSCSWPAYIGDNETTKPFATYIADGCNLWRNWDDIQCDWGSLSSIIEHWGAYGSYLVQWAAPGYWHDPDMLLIGNDCISDDEARTQMAIWSITASPLIMGNDLRTVNASQRAILLNPEAIAVDQDPMGRMGLRISPSGPTEVWARNLTGGAIALGLYNKLGSAPAPPAPCPSWNETTGGYIESCSGNTDCFSGVPLATAQDACCKDGNCAGFSYAPADQSGCYKRDQACGIVPNNDYVGYGKPGFAPQACSALDITVDLSTLGFSSTAKVLIRDIWAQADVGVFSGSYTSKAVPCHGTAFFKLTQQ